jgi:SAM-dependent methyltransferase
VNPGLAFKIKSLLEEWALRKIVHWLSPGSAVLDIGCGDGRLLDNLRKVCPEGTILQGIEISEVAAQEARRKGYQVTVASIDQLHPGPERYDLICLIQVIEHVFDPVGCLKKVYSMLRPGGLVLIETPSTKCLDFTLFHSRYWGGYHFPRHLNLFDPVGLSKLLTNQKFEILSISHKLQPVHWVWTCHHYFQDRGYPDWWSEWFHIKSPIPLAVFTLVDAVQLLLSGRSSNMRILAQR